MNSFVISLTKKDSVKPKVLKTYFFLPKNTLFIYDEITYEVKQLIEVHGKKVIICEEW